MSEYKEGFSAKPIPAELRKLMMGRTYKENSLTAFEELSYLQVLHYDYNHNISKGELVVSQKLEKEILKIFYELFLGEYEIEKIHLCDYYNGDDEASMSDNNTSAFNYRTIAGTNTLSLHAMGRAVDINPKHNPYIVEGKVMPENAVQFADRNLAFSHKIDHEDLCFKVFAAYGWLWGGDWKNSKDYQHFYKPVEATLKTVVRRLAARIKM